MGSLAVGLGTGRDAMGWSDSETLNIASASAAGKVWSDHGAATVLRRFAMNLWSTYAYGQHVRYTSAFELQNVRYVVQHQTFCYVKTFETIS